MSQQAESRMGKYRSQAETLRVLAYQTRFLESRDRLLVLAKSLETLVERVETWGTARAHAAD